MLQRPPEHCAVPAPLVGPGQTVHALPQWVGSELDTQLDPHAWYPWLHAMVHTPPAHCAEPDPLVGPGQFKQLDPQFMGSMSLAQTPPQR